VLFSLFVSNFERYLWNEELALDQAQRLILQHTGGFGGQLRFSQLFVLAIGEEKYSASL
jgi:hypothetical protein